MEYKIDDDFGHCSSILSGDANIIQLDSPAQRVAAGQQIHLREHDFFATFTNIAELSAELLCM